MYLLEDGLELWLTVLHNTKHINQELMALTTNIPPILGERIRNRLIIARKFSFHQAEKVTQSKSL